MKFLLALTLIASVLPGDLIAQETVNQVYRKAQRALLAGDTEQAKQLFAKILETDPTHVQSQNYLRTILTKEKRNPGNTTKAKLTRMKLAEAKFTDATLGSVLDYIKQKAAEDSNGEVKLNFVQKLPEGYADQAKVTLSLTNTPYTVVLDYVAQLAKVAITYEPYAIVVGLPQAASTASEPAPAE